MEKKYYPRFRKGDLVRVVKHPHNSEKTKKYIGMVGVAQERSLCPFVEIGNDLIIFSDDELRFHERGNRDDQ